MIIMCFLLSNRDMILYMPNAIIEKASLVIQIQVRCKSCSKGEKKTNRKLMSMSLKFRDDD